MTNQFARFVHTTPLSSIPHDPPLSLASNCIRDFFGPTVQLVADCLHGRGAPSSLPQIIQTINSKSQTKSRTEERKEIIRVSKLRPTSLSSTGGTFNCSPPSLSAIRASLFVLIQHSIVKVTKTKISSSSTSNKTRKVYFYQFDLDRARLLSRYPRFVEYTKKALDETAATLIEELLVRGRMRTVDAIVATVEQLHQLIDAPRSDRYTYRQAVLESFRRLVENGFIQKVKELDWDSDDPDDEVREQDYGGANPPTSKKRRVQIDDTEDPTVVSLLQSGPSKFLPRDAIWRVNLQMFHDSLRALSLGWLVAERYGHKVQSAGSMVTAALRLAAHREHAEHNNPNNTNPSANFESHRVFTVDNMQRYINKTVWQNLDKKPGGVLVNLHSALMELSKFTNPSVVEEVEAGDGHPLNTKFQISTRKLVNYLQDRIVHQVILDSHGEVAARICSILKFNGHMESDAIAEAAMVPAKDTREVLHRLYRENYISLFNLNQGKQHNPSSMFYLWSISRARIISTVTDNVCTALLNMRLRRQHQVEVGKDWIERAKEAGAIDENENEADKLNYTRFCKGLERLDSAALQLDETLMVLKDY